MGVFRGAGIFWRGVGLALSTPRLRRLVLAPSLLAAFTAAFGASALFRWLNHSLRAWLEVDGGVEGFLIATLVFLLSLIGLYLMFLLAAGVINAPFAGPLSERTEEAVTGTAPPPQSGLATFKEILRSIWHAVLLFSVFLLTLVPLVVLHWLLPLLAPFLLAQTAIFLAYDGLDPSLSRGGARSFGAKWAFLRANFGACLGFGLVGALLLGIPILNFFVPPLTAVGGTLLYRALTTPSATSANA